MNCITSLTLLPDKVGLYSFMLGRFAMFHHKMSVLDDCMVYFWGIISELLWSFILIIIISTIHIYPRRQNGSSNEWLGSSGQGILQNIKIHFGKNVALLLRAWQKKKQIRSLLMLWPVWDIYAMFDLMLFRKL